MATKLKGPKPHPTKWTLVFTSKLRRFNTLQEAEAELEKALVRGDRGVYPAAARGVGGQTLRLFCRLPHAPRRRDHLSGPGR